MSTSKLDHEHVKYGKKFILLVIAIAVVILLQTHKRYMQI